MAQRGPYKQKCTIPKPAGMAEAVSVIWDILVNHPDRAQRRAAKRTLMKMGYRDLVANISVDPRVPVLHEHKAKRPQTEKQKARSAAFFAKVKAERLDLHPSDISAPEAAVGSQNGTVEGSVEAERSVNPSTAGLGFVGSYFDLPRPVLPPAAPQTNQKLTYAEAKDRGYTVQIGTGMYQGVRRYKVSDGSPFVVCRNEDEAPQPISQPRPSINTLFSRPQPKNFNKPACVGVCTCSDRDCGRR